MGRSAVKRAQRAASALGLYLEEIRAYPLLDQEEEAAIGRRISGAMNEAAARLVESNLRFVAKIAREYQSLGMPLEDLLGEGNLGLIHAAKRFDPAKGHRFITYASWWIRKMILVALARHLSPVRVPNYQRRKMASQRAEAEASQERRAAGAPGPVPDPRLLHCRAVSLDDPIGPNGRRTFVEALSEERSVDPESELIRKESLAHVTQLLSSLNTRERAVLSRRFGLSNAGEETLKDLGSDLGLTRERVRQIEKEAIVKLRLRFNLAARPRPQTSKAS